ncbi:SMG7 [Acanthosepion pharaonis]|uniref:SMG7 n=1 Tax=Acanthosepion pharaonis TaxID=158019 RepID=A0A812DH81_ACAPH|nr:SMG7 [Sepia pharaonis]
MSTAPQVLRQAEALKATVADPSKNVSEVWVSRQKLEDLYKKLLIMDLEYALDKKVEQDLWNHAFKNQINILQTQAKDNQVRNPKRLEVQASLNLFLETASGFYLQLLQLLCATFKLDLPFRRKSSAYGIMKEKNPLKAKITPPKKNSCLYICQHCLVHLGDIARYRQEVDQAQTYYWHAANLVPSNGQPYNQLAILEAARGNKLTTVFYYIRSLAVRHPFPVAATNLEKFYGKLAKDSTDFKGKLSMSEVIAAFLQFHALIHLNADFDRAAGLSEKLLSSLPAHVTSQSFSTPMLIQIIAINLFTMHHAKRQMNDGVFEATGQNEKQEYLSKDEEKGFEMAFNFTVLLLDILLHYTPKQEQKLRDFFTLPAIKILLDWLWSHPLYFCNNFLKSSNVWSNLSKLLNTVQDQPLNGESLDLPKYFDMPLPEDHDLRCFQPIEKAHSNYNFDVGKKCPTAEVEVQLRAQRLVNHGKWIVEKCSDLRLLSMQVTKSGRLHFQSPGNQPPVQNQQQQQYRVPCSNATDGKENKGDIGHSNVDKKPSRQNVAIQAIIQKQNQNPDKNSPDKEVKNINKQLMKISNDNQSKACNMNPHRYLLGVPTTDPQFMKPGGNRPVSIASTQQSVTKPGVSPHSTAPSPLNLLPPSPTPNNVNTNQFSPSLQYRGPSPSFSSHVPIPPVNVRQQQQQMQQQQQQQYPPVSQTQFPRRGPYLPSQPPTQIQGGVNERYPGGGNNPMNRLMSAGGPLPPQPDSNQFSVGNTAPPPPPPHFTGGGLVRPPPSQQQQGPQASAQSSQGQGPVPSSQVPAIPPNFTSSQSFLPPSSKFSVAVPSQPPNGGPLSNHQFLSFSSQPPPPGPSHYPQAYNSSGDSLKGQKPTNNMQCQKSTPSPIGGPLGGPHQNPVSHHQQQQQASHQQGLGQGQPQPPQPPQSQVHPESLNKSLLNPLGTLSQSLGLSLANSCSPTEDTDPGDLQQSCDEFNTDTSEILGGFSHLVAIQPPKSTQIEFLASSKPFQGHAEGVPKPDSPPATLGKNLLGTDNECLSGTSHEINSQPGTYSLFSSSPWSVHITAAGDSKSLGSSPFSSQASSIRNSPDPLSENYGPDSSLVTTNFGSFGFTFSSSTDHWGTSQPATVPQQPPPAAAAATAAAAVPQQMPTGPARVTPSYLLHGNIQNLWPIPGPSPLKKLLEVQKQQRQNDPH